MIYFREIYLRKAITPFVLMFSMAQCLSVASLVFDNEKLYITEKGIMSVQTGLEVLKSILLLRLSTLLIWLLMLAFLKNFCTNHFNRSCVGFFYSSILEHIVFILRGCL